MPIADDIPVLCGKCKLPLDEDPHIQPEQRVPCPSCGSTARIFQVSIHDGVVIKSKLGMKGRHPGGGKPFIETVTGDDLQRNTGRWMKFSRTVDRENDLYQETVIDPTTDRVIRECTEPLSNHQGHGSAKYNKKTAKEKPSENTTS